MHGCAGAIAEGLIRGSVSLAEWRTSQNATDWLGDGIYFFQDAHERALDWAREQARRQGWDPEDLGVVGAEINLDSCFDLLVPANVALLRPAHADLRRRFDAAAVSLPTNSGKAPWYKRRDLDRLVVNHCLASNPGKYGTVRAVFEEGEPAYPGARIFTASHIQIAVRDRHCIRRVFRPNL